MTPSRYEIEVLVMRIQDEFLRTSAVRMTLEQIARRLNASVGLCKAVLRLLVDARVLAVTPDGVYERFFPQRAAQPRVSRASAA